MNASLAPRVVGALVIGAMVTAPVISAFADEPGDLIIERSVTPRIAYRPVPVQDDPVKVRVTTFPSSTVDPLMEGLASDIDLGNARGSSGVQSNGVDGALGAATAALGIGSGAQQRGGLPAGIGGQGGGVAGVGATVSQTITGALAPVISGMGSLK
ncbi:hypothetical protein [Pararobbsia silviterrae]|uniref:Uncharacterized protein n=1 Tax=Pararobbsia silviterrae TaxID=1792498 RepID=A0A494YEP3_9BURK|nr:hypothetical protein [Pararobbsia silviterrae]RKP59188.1 hypothetical protein D7S86_04640 [Pararobbsia silviterrae]